MLDHASSVRLEPGHGAADVGVDFDDFFDGGGFEEGGGDAFFDAEEDAVGGCYLWISYMVRDVGSIRDSGEAESGSEKGIVRL